MPATATMTANSPSSPKAGCEPGRREDPQQAERRPGRGELHEGDRDDVDRGHDRDPPERDAVPRDHQRRSGEHEDHHDAREEQHDVAGERADRDQDAEDEDDGAEQQLIEGGRARAGAVGEVLAQPAGARA